MKKRVSLIAAVLCCCLAFGACANKQDHTQKDPSGTSIDRVKTKLDVLKPIAYSSVSGLSLEPGSYISIIGRYSDDSYWKEVESGAKQAVADLNTMLGYKGDKKIKLTYSAPEIRDDVNEQVAKVELAADEMIASLDPYTSPVGSFPGRDGSFVTAGLLTNVVYGFLLATFLIFAALPILQILGVL